MYEFMFVPKVVTYRLRPKRDYISVHTIVVERKVRNLYFTVVEFKTNNNSIVTHEPIDNDTHEFLFKECMRFAKTIGNAPINFKMSEHEINEILINYLSGLKEPVNSSFIVQELAHSEITAANKIRKALKNLRKIECVDYTGIGWKARACTN